MLVLPRKIEHRREKRAVEQYIHDNAWKFWICIPILVLLAKKKKLKKKKGIVVEIMIKVKGDTMMCIRKQQKL